MNIKKILMFIFVTILLSGCVVLELITGYYYMGNYQPKTITFSHNYEHIFGIIENGKINRMGVSKNDINTLNLIIQKKYGIQFISDQRIYSLENVEQFNYIKFFNDFKITVNMKEYIIPKQQIQMEENTASKNSIYYSYGPLPINISDENINDIILDIGEIEIINREGKVIKERVKIPPLLFKRVKYRKRITNWQGDGEIYYSGWAENYHEYDESKEKEIEENQDKKEK